MNEKKRVFKKYQDNRRLYDETGETYATIGDIVISVMAGEEVSVIATKGRSKVHKEAIDITQGMLIDAFHKQQRDNPTVTIEDLVRLMRGQRPTWEN